MDDRRTVSTTRLSSNELTRVTFTTLRKGGVDPNEVRLHLEAAAREMGHLESRVRELQDQLSEAHHLAEHPTFDEATLTNALGTQSASILCLAHEEAGRVTAEAQERSAAVYAEAQQRASAHLMDAQERATALITEAENTGNQIDHDSRLAAERLIDSAKVNGEALIDRAREQGRAIVEQANEARRTVLNDLAVKRKALHMQIDQLRAARDTLGTFVGELREKVDDILTGINGSDEAARSAALEALRAHATVPEPTDEELLAGTPLREVPAPTLDAPIDSTPEITRRSDAVPPPAPARTAPHEGESLLEDDPSGTDVVNEIFARLRKATLEERGATAVAPKKVAPAKPETPVGTLFRHRDDALDEALSVLTRRVKRVLQDDQNIMLERIRHVKAMITDELEDEMVQRNRYAEAASEGLVLAAQSGVQFARDEGGVSETTVEPSLLDDVAADLAVTIVLALRKRILSESAGDATDRVNAAYREWRGARVERLCTDAARRAFHLGVVTASKGRSVRFFATPNDAPCDLCAHDADSGERLAGENFPSGSPYPPLHAGCACTVIPV